MGNMEGKKNRKNRKGRENKEGREAMERDNGLIFKVWRQFPLYS